MKLFKITAVLLALAFSSIAQAQDDVITTSGTHWEGFHIGGNIGGGWSHTCDTWSASTQVTSNPGTAAAFYNRDCPTNDTFIGGVQMGYDFQYNLWVWGLGLDYEFYSSKIKRSSYTYTGAIPPPNGAYSFSNDFDPNGFLLLTTRVGYAIDQWLPFLRVGAVFTSGSRHSTASYTDGAGTATFAGGKNYNSSGFAVGAGVEYAMFDRWSVSAEYTYLDLGGGNNTATGCTGSTTTCAAFGNVELDNIHSSVTASLFRVGINYRF
jgi:outer membrane immunogenic protein